MNPLLEIDRLLFDDPPPGDGDDLVTATIIGKWLGLSANRVGALARQGHLPRGADGRYPLRATVAAYCRFARESALARQGGPDLATEKLRLARETADKLALANAKARGDLLDAAEVAREWASVLRDVRAAVLAIPIRVHQKLGHLTDEDIRAIDQEVRDMLGPVDVHLRRMIVAAMAMKAPKLSSVLQHRVAIPLNSLSFPKKFSIRCRHL